MQTISKRGAERTLTKLDFARLLKLANEAPPEWLTKLLDGVNILDARELPSDTVSMYTTVECQDLHTGRRQQLTICYPNDAEPAAGFVSVLSPVGFALLGLRAGDVARWQTPSGEGGGAHVLFVLFQPEASGDNTMSTTILDRLMHRSTLLEFEGKSYRLKEAAARMARDTTND